MVLGQYTLRPFFIKDMALEHQRSGHLIALVNRGIPAQAQGTETFDGTAIVVRESRLKSSLRYSIPGFFPCRPLLKSVRVNCNCFPFGISLSLRVMFGY